MGTSTRLMFATEQATVVADAPPAGKSFTRWIGDTQYLANPFASSSLVTMPAGPVTVTAAYSKLYGYLYNKFAVLNAANICALGWHVPTHFEFLTLIASLGGLTVAGGHMKEAGLTHWVTPNTGADNSVLFNGYGAGRRSTGGDDQLKYNTWYHASDYMLFNGVLYGYFMRLQYGSAATEVTADDKRQGKSVRLIKDDSTDLGYYIGNDGKAYTTIKVGNIVIMNENLCETLYRTGATIPTITNVSTFFADTTGCKCAYQNNENNV